LAQAGVAMHRAGSCGEHVRAVGMFSESDALAAECAALAAWAIIWAAEHHQGHAGIPERF